MDTLLEWLEYVEESEDSRQSGKVRHRLKDILVIVLLATLANADDWVEIGIFAQYHEEFLRKNIRLENGILVCDCSRPGKALGVRDEYLIPPADFYLKNFNIVTTD